MKMDGVQKKYYRIEFESKHSTKVVLGEYCIYCYETIQDETRKSILDFLAQILLDLHVPWDKLDYIFCKLGCFSEFVFEKKKINCDDNEITIYIYPKNIKIL